MGDPELIFVSLLKASGSDPHKELMVTSLCPFAATASAPCYLKSQSFLCKPELSQVTAHSQHRRMDD